MKPKIMKIYSENNAFQHAEVLKRNRVKRQKNGKFFVEGVRSINQLVNSAWKIDSFLFSSDKKLSKWAQNILETSRAKIHYDLKQELLQKLSDKEEASELIALVNMPKDDLSRIKKSDNLLVVVLDRPTSPGNLGTIIRSCNSLNVDGIIITGHATDLYGPHTIQGAVGSLFSIPIIRLESHKEVLEWVEKLKEDLQSLQIIGTSAKADKYIEKQDFTIPTILLIGNESLGLSNSYKSMCDELVKIPISGVVSSLNIGCATSIFLYEIQRQRGF